MLFLEGDHPVLLKMVGKFSPPTGNAFNVGMIMPIQKTFADVVHLKSGACQNEKTESSMCHNFYGGFYPKRRLSGISQW